MAIAIRAKQGLTRRQLLVRSASIPCAGRNGRARHTLSQPRRGSSADRRRHCVGRCLDRFRGDMGARRPARAHAGGVFDASKVSRPSFARHPRTRCRIMTSRQSCCSRVCRPGRIFSIGCGLRISPNPEYQAKPRSGISAPRRVEQAFDLVCLVRRYRGPGLGHRSLPRRHAHLPDHAGKPSGFLHSFRRSHLCRLSGRQPN